MQITVHLTRKEYGDSVAYLTRKEVNQVKKTRYKLIINILSAITWIPLCIALMISSTINTGIAAFLGFSVVWLLVFAQLGQKLYRRYWERLPKKPESMYGPKEYQLTDAGLKAQWSYGYSEISWSSVSDIIQFKGLTLLIIDEFSAYIFPERCFQSSQEYDEFHGKVRAYMKAS